MRRRSSRRSARFAFNTRAPRRGTLVVAAIAYFIGLFGMLGIIQVPQPYASYALAFAGGLLILGSLLRSL